MPRANDDDEKWTIEYICFGARPKSSTWAPRTSTSTIVLRPSALRRTIEPGQQTAGSSTARVYSNQTYRDAKIMEDVERREFALTERLVDVAATCPESAIALRPSRDEFLPDALEAEMREPIASTSSGKTKARAPFPSSYHRPSDEYLEHDYRVQILKQEGDEDSDYEDDNPAVTSIYYGDDGWPLQLQRIPFSDAQSMHQTLFATFGKDLVRKFTRVWRRSLCKMLLIYCPFPAHALFDPCRVHRLKKPADETSARSSHQQVVPPDKNVTLKRPSDASCNESGVEPKKRPNQRGGKIRRQEVGRKKKAQLRAGEGPTK
ncbi:hypothetical protein EXIGLDRAFT_694662 [Exidia glandulosa HHB12029]|uniref:Uncharacterized protein n=1 Tax=Exidia glandulosa HHB12029 TaxID=1314781 RepID=A0A165GGH3_EXIGL|nr:hypothetical protein EXIGLDRAFT_694662 [Exidia glandulosa HHB12029]